MANVWWQANVSPSGLTLIHAISSFFLSAVIVSISISNWCVRYTPVYSGSVHGKPSCPCTGHGWYDDHICTQYNLLAVTLCLYALPDQRSNLWVSPRTVHNRDSVWRIQEWEMPVKRNTMNLIKRIQRTSSIHTTNVRINYFVALPVEMGSDVHFTHAISSSLDYDERLLMLGLRDRKSVQIYSAQFRLATLS